MTRKLIEAIYYHTALRMPHRWAWCCVFQMRARAYFEVAETPGFTGWPWRWSADDVPGATP